MATNPDKITQFANDTSTDPAQYPLTTVDYAMVPTCGLPQAKVTAISQFLNNVSTTAQDFGTSPGDLPFGGYLALTNQQKAQTQAAATKVSTQACTSPPPDTTVSGVNTSNVGTSGGLNGNGPGVSGSTAPGTTSNAPSTTGANRGGNGTTPSGNTPQSKSNTPLGLKSMDTNGFASFVLPVALGLGGLLLLIAGATYALNATEAGRAFLNRLRRRLGMSPRIDEFGDSE
jgi:hypothetical protein